MKQKSKCKAKRSSVAELPVHPIHEILKTFKVDPKFLANYLGTSLVTVSRWERGDTKPDSALKSKLVDVLNQLKRGEGLDLNLAVSTHVFASRGARRCPSSSQLSNSEQEIAVHTAPKSPIISRLRSGEFWRAGGSVFLDQMLARRKGHAPTIKKPIIEHISAGKNTYTYDAHTYHTKVPPQGIAEILRRYLPQGGIVLDPFAGSGMTGVAARTLGMDVVLNELSPAASFIADRFTSQCDTANFSSSIRMLLNSLADLRGDLYSTNCRECGNITEILYTVWSYRVCCYKCNGEFVLWDHCRHYGKTVREHKILREFDCPVCKTLLQKSRLKRTVAVPVLLGYKCCSRKQVEHKLTQDDHRRLEMIHSAPPLATGYVPTIELPDGVNLCQPKRHGLTSVDRLYTVRNLSAMSHLWREIHKFENAELAGFLAFSFTSLYQRVTRLSEFRFWGGSGNTANFNVPYIFNEANVFVSFERKARSIQDHLETTAKSYTGQCVVHTGSSTEMRFLPDNSIDLIFTDPPFGANINYSEMNILWESWLGAFTDSKYEAIVNRFQGKDIIRYGELMKSSLRECHRVLRPGHWMVLVFMNSSEEVWNSLRNAVIGSGFSIERVDIFDKQHGTFKQFVSDNTAGCDLLLHCLKGKRQADIAPFDGLMQSDDQIRLFLKSRSSGIPKLPYLHVVRHEEVDYRMLYSEFLAQRLLKNGHMVSFTFFRQAAASILNEV